MSLFRSLLDALTAPVGVAAENARVHTVSISVGQGEIREVLVAERQCQPSQNAVLLQSLFL